jgi:hypothetical protein
VRAARVARGRSRAVFEKTDARRPTSFTGQRRRRCRRC